MKKRSLLEPWKVLQITHASNLDLEKVNSNGLICKLLLSRGWLKLIFLRTLDKCVQIYEINYMKDKA